MFTLLFVIIWVAVIIYIVQYKNPKKLENLSNVKIQSEPLHTMSEREIQNKQLQVLLNIEKRLNFFFGLTVIGMVATVILVIISIFD